MKYISPKEFRDLGLVHEINRTILHPLGLALETRPDDDVFRVQDWRESPEGMCYAEGVVSREKAENVYRLRQQRERTRLQALGFIVQPLPPKRKKKTNE